MHRSKVWAVVAALVAASSAAIVLAGSASAASWHVYEGDMFAGHAYALQVPSAAESVEFLFEGEAGSAAAIGVYAPDGAQVGFYELSPALTAASVANPAPGQYVVYVYEVFEGALSVRVQSEAEPALKLDEVPLVREETKVGTFPQGKLDQVITVDLQRTPVFVTLLYEGSARDLDATVASVKGTVVTITDESATAFSPGVWTSLKGERVFDAANLDGSEYAVEVHAESFEGTMVLTTLALQVPEPVPVGTAPEMPSAPGRLGASAPLASPAQFALEPETPIAFVAPVGTLLLVDPEMAARRQAEASSETYEGDDHRSPRHALVSIYAPDDTLLAVVELTREAPAAELALPVEGEYVAFVREAQSDFVLASIVGALAPPEIRMLEMASESVEIDVSALLGDDESAERIAFARAPLDIELLFRGGVGALAGVQLENEEGVVASAQALVLTPFDGMPIDWSYTDHALLAAGEHTLRTHGAFEGSIELVTTYYLRDIELLAEPAEEEGGEDPEGDGRVVPGLSRFIPDLF